MPQSDTITETWPATCRAYAEIRRGVPHATATELLCATVISVANGFIPGISNTVTLAVDQPDGSADAVPVVVTSDDIKYAIRVLSGSEDGRLRIAAPFVEDINTLIQETLLRLVANLKFDEADDHVFHWEDEPQSE